MSLRESGRQRRYLRELETARSKLRSIRLVHSQGRFGLPQGLASDRILADVTSLITRFEHYAAEALKKVRAAELEEAADRVARGFGTEADRRRLERAADDRG